MSKIEVNTIEPQCGTTVTVGKCTSTVAVPGNVVKSNALQASDGGVIISQSGTDITVGASGDTVTLASGASQSGFGRTGTVDWDTSIHTGTVTAATGKGYFVNTTSGGITVNLPAAAVGSIVAVSDYASTSASNNITVEPNGSDKINGVNDGYIMSTAGLAVTLVYADATKGWKSVTGSDADATGVTPLFVVATGGNQPTAGGCIVCTNYKIHKFTGPGTFCVSAAGNACGSNTVDYMIVAGGAGGGYNGSGGGGAGGWRATAGTASGCYTAGPSPLTSPVSPMSVSATPYAIVVGAGGGAGTTPSPGPATVGIPGSVSSFNSITSAGGGGGGGPNPNSGLAGGSGGGTGRPPGEVGVGNTPPTTPPQGNTGGSQTGPGSGAGGGAIAVGGNGAGPSGPGIIGGLGGAGSNSSISGSPVAYSGGGGGGSDSYTGSGGTGGAGGGGTGGGGGPPASVGGNGTVNTGGGAGGAGNGQNGGSGGSGIVYIRYKFQ